MEGVNKCRLTPHAACAALKRWSKKMKIAGVMFLVSLAAVIARCDEESNIPSFGRSISQATIIEILPTRERSITFSNGSVLRPEDGQDSEVKNIFTVFLQATDMPVRVTFHDRMTLKELPKKPYDATAEPMIGWAGSVVIRLNSENGEPQYWICRLMNAGFLSFYPTEELYEPESNGRSLLFQGHRSEAARKLAFTSKSPVWMERIRSILKKDGRRKKAQAEQDGADQPATAPESKSEGKKKLKPEAEGRPQ